MSHAETSIGEQELALLRHIADEGTATVGEAAETLGVIQWSLSYPLVVLEKAPRINPGAVPVCVRPARSQLRSGPACTERNR